MSLCEALLLRVGKLDRQVLIFRLIDIGEISALWLSVLRVTLWALPLRTVVAQGRLTMFRSINRFFTPTKAAALICAVLLAPLGYGLYHSMAGRITSIVLIDLFVAVLTAFFLALCFIGVENSSSRWSTPLMGLAFPAFGFSGIYLAFVLLMTLIKLSSYSDDVRLQDSYDKGVNDQAVVLGNWLDGFSEPQHRSSLEPPGQLSGKYLEVATGPYTEDLDSSYVSSGHTIDDGGCFRAIRGRSASMHTPLSYDDTDSSHKMYTIHDAAEYIVIVHTYAEHKTSTDVTVRIYTPATGLTGSPYDSVETATASSVVVAVVDRKTKAIIASRDVSRPEEWLGGGGAVHCRKLAEVDTWLSGLGLQESEWLSRDDRQEQH